MDLTNFSEDNLIGFIETPYFSKKIKELLEDKEYAELQGHLRLYPDDGDLMQGTGGVRKVRWNLTGTGKSGGIRVLYYYIDENNVIFMLDVFAKSKKINLTASEKNAIKQVIMLIKQRLKNG